MANTNFGWVFYLVGIPIMIMAIMTIVSLMSFFIHEAFILIGHEKHDGTVTSARVTHVSDNPEDEPMLIKSNRTKPVVVLENDSHRFIIESEHLLNAVKAGEECIVTIKKGYSRFRFLSFKFHFRDMVTEVNNIHVFKKSTMVAKTNLFSEKNKVV
jgi:hypothetical protein